MREEKKDLKLINIYIRIHNKQVLTMDDLAYLAKYNPVCFKKTCDNLIYKMPETKALVKAPGDAGEPEKERQRDTAVPTARSLFDMTAEEMRQDEQVVRQMIENLENIESGETDTLQCVDLDQVKELLGNLFMENLFPHNGRQGYFDVTQTGPGYTFNARV